MSYWGRHALVLASLDSLFLINLDPFYSSTWIPFTHQLRSLLLVSFLPFLAALTVQTKSAEPRSALYHVRFGPRQLIWGRIIRMSLPLTV